MAKKKPKKNNPLRTLELRDRVKNKNKFPHPIGYNWLLDEPYVVVDEIIEPYTNWRATFVIDQWFIPMATYDEKKRTKYTSFEDCELWQEAYGEENVFVGVFDEEINNLTE